MDTTSIEYKIAFEKYLRRGSPIELSLKQQNTATHYTWRTRKDGKVRPSHAANDGKIFAWDNPPPTGHPGEDYGCRCIAVTYTPAFSEYFDITLHGVSDTGPAWTKQDFIEHYFNGNGKTVTVREIGHLTSIVAEYRRIVIDDPNRLPGQIADEARKNVGKSFPYPFYDSYNMQNVVFSVGDTVIRGNFVGHNKLIHNALEITGEIEFKLEDNFSDPFDIVELRDGSYDLAKKLIAEAVIALRKVVNVALDAADIARQVISRVESAFGYVDQALEEYIHRLARRELIRRQKNFTLHLERKQLVELPFSTIYNIVDNWRASVSAKVYLDATKSRFSA